MAPSAWVRSSALLLAALAAAAQETRDATAWGADHAGKPVPQFVHGDECLFCHRNDIGPGWQKNAHGLTNRQREDAPDLFALLAAEPKLKSFSAEAGYSLGSRNHVRYLHKSGYGKFDVSSFRADLDKDRKVQWQGLGASAWEKGKFENQCAG